MNGMEYNFRLSHILKAQWVMRWVVNPES